jgi:hypothetical protein
MALKKFRPKSPDKTLGTSKGDTTYARFAHLNSLVSDVDTHKADKEIHNISYPFVWYPESTLFNAGPIYHYPSGMGMGFIPDVTLNNYKVRGVIPYSGSSVISVYLGTIKLIPTGELYGAPILFPGKITGMVAAVEGDTVFFDPTLDITTTPIADGAKMWDIDAGVFNTLYGVKIIMSAYYENPDPVTGEINYALVLEAYGSVPTSDLGAALISYEFEFVAGNSNVTLWWD